MNEKEKYWHNSHFRKRQISCEISKFNRIIFKCSLAVCVCVWHRSCISVAKYIVYVLEIRWKQYHLLQQHQKSHFMQRIYIFWTMKIQLKRETPHTHRPSSVKNTARLIPLVMLWEIKTMKPIIFVKSALSLSRSLFVSSLHANQIGFCYSNHSLVLCLCYCEHNLIFRNRIYAFTHVWLFGIEFYFMSSK